jgi:large subunit ribosomal protein L22
MEAVAKNRFIRISPRKLRLVCDLISGKRVDEALSILDFTPKKGAKILSKALLSAVANARNQQNVDEDRLYVKHALAETGPIIKRSLARGRGSVTPILKRTSHLTVVIDEHGS